MKNSSETHLFIIWNTALEFQDQILKDTADHFSILSVHRVTWSKQYFSDNMSRFYGQKLPSKSAKIKQCGTGPFLVITVIDENPNHEDRKTSAKTELVNSNMFDAKERYRKLSGGGHRIHGTNNECEYSHDSTLLFGLVDVTNDIWDGKITDLKQDVIGANGWQSLEELFSTLNATIPYVVLRNFEGFPDNYLLESHGDIDILTTNPTDISYITNAKKIHFCRRRVHYEVKIAGDLIPFDFRYVGDDYYDSSWQSDILDSRRLLDGNFYVPDAKNYFYSLLYHALIHKEVFASDYKERLKGIAVQEDLTDPKTLDTKDSALDALNKFLKQNRYKVSDPTDLSVVFNPPPNYPGDVKPARRIKNIRRRLFKSLKSILSSSDDINDVTEQLTVLGFRVCYAASCNSQTEKFTAFGNETGLIAVLRNTFLNSSRASSLLSELKSPFFAAKSFNVIKVASSDSQTEKLLGILITTNRRKEFQTRTEILEAKNDTITCKKLTINGEHAVSIRKLTLKPTESVWQNTPSLQDHLISSIKSHDVASLEDVFSDCAPWFSAIKDKSENGLLPGNMLDAVWGNSYLESNKLTFIDLEWIWHEAIPLEVLAIRTTYVFFTRIEGISTKLDFVANVSRKDIISKICKMHGIELRQSDFTKFIELESEFQSLVKRRSPFLQKQTLRLNLTNHKLYNLLKTGL